MQKALAKILELLKENPSAEVFKIQSMDGETITRCSFDEKDCSCENRYKKEGFMVLFNNY